MTGKTDERCDAAARSRAVRQRPNSRSVWRSLPLLVLLLITPRYGEALQAPRSAPDPFDGFTSFLLPNGLRVWYQQMPAAGVASISLSVPYGHDQDAPGQEGTAHLLEHLLFHDRQGRSEAELNREIEDRGGVFNARTGPDRTSFYLTIGAEHTRLALEWLYGVIEPRPFTAAAVAASRKPVELELGARPRSALEQLLRSYAAAPKLRPPGFWEREFGLPVEEERLYDPLESLQAITAADLEEFHRRFYSPAVMTLVVVTSQPLSQVQQTLLGTFGMLPWTPPAPQPDVALRVGDHDRYFWSSGAGQYTVRFRMAGLDSRDRLRLLFVEDMLQRRLLQRLRLGDTASVYSIDVGDTPRGNATVFSISAAIEPGHHERVRNAIDAEIGRLADPGDTAAFYADRDALSRQLRLAAGTPAGLNNFLLWRVYALHRFDTAPAMGEYYATVGPDSVAAWVQRNLTDGHRTTGSTRPVPVPVSLLIALAAVVVAGAVMGYRLLMLRPASMENIRFVARVRRGPVQVAVGVFLLFVALPLLLRGILLGAEWALHLVILHTPSFAVHAAAAGILLAGMTLGLLACLGAVPAKVLVFTDEVRLKSLTYRSRRWALTDIAAASLEPPGGWLRPASVRLHLVGGHTVPLRVRRPDVLLGVLESLGLPADPGTPSRQAHPPSEPTEPYPSEPPVEAGGTPVTNSLQNPVADRTEHC